MASVGVVNCQGKKYVRVFESYRQEDGKYRTRILENHGNLEKLLAKDPDYVVKLRARVAEENAAKHSAKVAEYAATAQQSLDTLRQRMDESEKPSPRMRIPMYNLGSGLLRRVWNELSLPQFFYYQQSKEQRQYSYDKACFLLCCERILHLGSNANAFENRLNHIYPFEDITKLQTVYHVLDLLKADKESIVRRLNRSINKHIKRNMSLALVTTYSFASRPTESIRQFGMSKEHKRGEVQVVLGLVIDQHGIPVDYDLLLGNTSELGSMLPMLKSFVATYHIERCIVVAESALNAHEILSDLREIGCDVIITQKGKDCTAQQKEEILREDNWNNNICDKTTGELLCRYKEININKDVFALKERKTTEMLDVKWIVSYSTKRAHQEHTELDRTIEEANKAIENNIFPGSSRAFMGLIDCPRGEGRATINERRVVEARQWLGYYAFCTTRQDISPQEVTSIQRQLWRIEDCVRLSKTQFEARPRFVWTPSRIKGLFASCYLSLVLESYLFYRLKKGIGDKITLETMTHALRHTNGLSITSHTGEALYILPQEDGIFDKICKVLGVEHINTVESQQSLGNKLGMRIAAPNMSSDKMKNFTP